MGLITLPMVTAKARDRSNGFVDMSNFFAKKITSGVPMIAMVSFIRNAERKPNANNMKRTSSSTVLDPPQESVC